MSYVNNGDLSVSRYLTVGREWGWGWGWGRGRLRSTPPPSPWRRMRASSTAMTTRPTCRRTTRPLSSTSQASRHIDTRCKHCVSSTCRQDRYNPFWINPCLSMIYIQMTRVKICRIVVSDTSVELRVNQCPTCYNIIYNASLERKEIVVKCCQLIHST